MNVKVTTARTLLWCVPTGKIEASVYHKQLQFSSAQRKKYTNSTHFSLFQKLIGEVFNIVSQQSTARPGCIIELDAITNKVNKWLTL